MGRVGLLPIGSCGGKEAFDVKNNPLFKDVLKGTLPFPHDAYMLLPR